MRRLILIGAGVGVLVSLAMWLPVWNALASGGDVPGTGMGASHMAFFVSLPWSLAVWFVMILPAITGMDGPAVLIPSFFVMPIVAGICWAWILAKILKVRPRALTEAGQPRVLP